MFEPKTKNFNARKSQMLIVHGTETDEAVSHSLMSGAAGIETSGHYYIDDKGNIRQYLDESVRAWHAGKSYWAGFKDINSISVSVELLAISKNRVFSGPETFYTDAQIDALAELAKGIIERHKIQPYHILGHQDIASSERILEPMLFETVDELYAAGHDVSLERKYDPGPKFPWAKLATKGVGLWHDLQPSKDDSILTDKRSSCDLRTLLMHYGYDTRREDMTHAIEAFQTHFLPWNICGKPTRQTFEAAKILVEKKLQS